MVDDLDSLLLSDALSRRNSHGGSLGLLDLLVVLAPLILAISVALLVLLLVLLGHRLLFNLII